MRHVALVAPLLLLACRHSAPPAPAPAPTPPAARAAADAAAPTPADPLALVRARGELHGAPVAFGATAARPAGRVAFTGTAESAWGAWAVLDAPGGASLRAVEGWPSAVRVLFAVAAPDNEAVYVMVETLAALDRVAGSRSVLVLRGSTDASAAWSAEPAPVQVLRAAAETSDGPALLRAFEGDRRLTLTEARCEALRRSSRTPAGFARAVPEAGLELYARHADGLVVREGTVPRADVARSPRAAAAAAALRATSVEFCDDASVNLVAAGAALQVRAAVVPAVEPAPAAPFAPPAAPRAVEARADNSDVERFLRARYPGDARVLAGAPLGPAGSAVAVAHIEAFEPNVVVFAEGGAFRVAPLGRAVNINDDRVRAARFLDADGDGRTDVAVETESAVEPQADSHRRAVGHRGLYLSPPPTFAGTLDYDLGSAVVMNTAESLDAAVAALARVPWRGVTEREACPLVQATRTLAGVRRVGTADLRVVFFEEPGAPGWQAEYRPLAEYRPADGPFWDGWMPCGNLSCSGSRPVCIGHYDEPGPGSTAYWFTWEGARLKLAAYALYSGS